MPRSLEDLIAQADELADRFEAFEPEPGDQTEPSALAALHIAAMRRAEAEREIAEAVAVAKRRRLSWAKIGGAIGTTGEAARQRYGRSKAAPRDVVSAPSKSSVRGGRIVSKGQEPQRAAERPAAHTEDNDNS